jgi:hypothetical protein
MEFVNHTPFAAQAFEGIDQHGQAFHVVVLRQTYTWNTLGELEFAANQQPLCESDEFFNSEVNPDSDDPSQESDLCPYKPQCDVIVNATAYAPRNTKGEAAPKRQFDVRLVVKSPDESAPVPVAPQGLNPYMAPSLRDMQQWQLSVKQAKTTLIPGVRLIDKTLRITGHREFERRNFALRAIANVAKLCTVGLIEFPKWKLTSPVPILQLQLCLSNSWGGDNRIQTTDKAAKRVPKKYLLTDTLATALAKANIKPPLAISAWQANPAGKGFATQWYLRATKLHKIAAPQISHSNVPIKVQHFELARRDKLDPDSQLAYELTAGFGVRPKGHPRRAKLAGTIDSNFIKSSNLLPEDFNFAVWNSAWPDQQISQLKCDEELQLTNLCASDTPAAVCDQRGNTVLKLTLPAQSAQVRLRLQSGDIFLHDMRLDTLLIEPETKAVSMVWRVVLPRFEDVAIRALEVQTMGKQKKEAFDSDVIAFTNDLKVAQKGDAHA